MIRKIFQAAKTLAQGSDAAPLSDEVLAEWESLSLQDAGVGDFVTLPNGAQMHYIARGPYIPIPVPRDVILIHGLMDSAYNWKKNIDAFAQGHRVWAIDLPGFGFSTRLTERVYTFKNFARWICAFMNAVEIQKASVIGHSLGGGVALQFAHDFPQRVKNLVLLAPAAYWWFPAPIRFVARMPFLPRAIVQFAMNSRHAHAAAWRMANGDPSRLDPIEVARRSRHLRVRGTMDALIALVGSPHESDLPGGLKNIKAPALILWGKNDLVLPHAHGERLMRDLPHARLRVIDNVGHIANEETPQIVNQAILDFLMEV
jgi:pimeloyl-ACP methyl ester carboxylesterase